MTSERMCSLMQFICAFLRSLFYKSGFLRYNLCLVKFHLGRFPIQWILGNVCSHAVTITLSEVKSLSCVRLFSTLWTAAYQAPPSMGFSRQEYWSGVPFPSPITLERQAISSSLKCSLMSLCSQPLSPCPGPGMPLLTTLLISVLRALSNPYFVLSFYL